MERLLANVEGVRRLARVLVRDPHRAEDVAQDTILAALERPPRDGWPLRAWLAGVARNMARRVDRSERRRTRREEAAARAEAVPSTADLAARMSEQRRLMDAVESLSPALRKVIWLRFWEDLPPRVIALRLDLPVETVRTRVKRACARLRASLDDWHDGERRRWRAALLPIANAGMPSASTSLIGGSLMTAKAKVTIAALAVAALALIAWRVGDTDTPPSRGPGARAPTELTAEAGAAPKLDARGAAREAPPVPETDAEARRLAGTVQARDGTPLREVPIHAGPRHVLRLDRLPLLGHTDATGRFDVVLPDEPVEMRVAVDAAGYLPEARVLAVESRATLGFRLHPVSLLHFRVRNGDTGARLQGVRCESVAAANGVEVISTARSDADGLIIIRDASPHRLEWRQRIRFLKDGFSPRIGMDRALLQSGHASGSVPRVIYLYPGEGLRVRVVDESGRGVAGARVEGWTGSNIVLPPLSRDPTSEEGSHAATVSLGSAETDADGYARLGTPLVEWSTWIARASHGDRRGWQTGFHHANLGPKAPEIVLLPTYRVEGTVVDENGTPVAAATVGHGLFAQAKGVDPRQSIPGMPPDLYRRSMRRTDAEGRFVFDALAIPPLGPAATRLPGGGRGMPLLCLAAGFKMKTAFVERPADGEAVIHIRIELEPSRTRLAVHVQNVAGKPIANALVRWRVVRPFGWTDGEGNVTLMGPFNDDIPLVVSAPGRAKQIVPVAKGTEKLTVTLREARVLEGRVLLEDDTPVAAHVDIYRAEVANVPKTDPNRLSTVGPRWITRVIAGADGRFWCAELSEEPVFVHAFAYFQSGPVPQPAATAESLATPGKPLELRMKRPEREASVLQTVSGRVEDTAGVRITRYDVLLRARDVKRRGRLALRPVQSGWRFRFEDVPPGPYVLEVTHAKRKARHEVDVHPGRDLEDVRVTALATATLYGRLTTKGATGSLAGLHVIAKATQGRQAFAITNPDGHFALQGLAPGRYALSLLAPTGAKTVWQVEETVLELAEGETREVSLNVERAARLVLVLDDEHFAENANAAHGNRTTAAARNSFASRVILIDAAGLEQSMQGLFHGRHACHWALANGTYTLRVEAGDVGRFETSFEVTGPEDVEITVRLSR